MRGLRAPTFALPFDGLLVTRGDEVIERMIRRAPHGHPRKTLALHMPYLVSVTVALAGPGRLPRPGLPQIGISGDPARPF